MNLSKFMRRTACEVRIGRTTIGGGHPVACQSMTNTDTNDTAASVAQIERIDRAGGKIVRLTAQGRREGENLENIVRQLRADGFRTAVVADIHFVPEVAAIAARYVDKVRVNPGNYRLDRGDLQALIAQCRERGVALRVGVNHGSLAKRVFDEWGDTPQGMVVSAMEFLRVCRECDFDQVVVSMKSSNTRVMVAAYRLLVEAMDAEDMHYPIHLGVTEAGNGIEGRVKSAVGIGALMADGIGDTLRVSLSEAPEAEVPVAYKLASYVVRRAGHPFIYGRVSPDFNYTDPQRRPTRAVMNIGGGQPPVVIGERIDGVMDRMTQQPDYLYCSRHLPETRTPGCGYIVDADVWQGEPDTYPAFDAEHLMMLGMMPAQLPKFLFLSYPALNDEVRACLRQHPEMVVIAQSDHANRLGELRALIQELWVEKLENPVVVFEHYHMDGHHCEDFQLAAAADCGALLFDGLADGLMLLNHNSQVPISHGVVDQTAFAILQATGARITRTEYISCPGCGRTLYDLQSTVARVKAVTAHLK